MYRTVAEIDAAVTAAKREGLISKDTLDWFQHKYSQQMKTACDRQRQEGTLDDREICRK